MMNSAASSHDSPLPPSKRVKLGTDSVSTSPAVESPATSALDLHVDNTIKAPSTADVASNMDRECGFFITEFVSPSALGFEGILKKRYTDFLVNEILPDGQVVHLTELRPKKTRAPVCLETKKGGDVAASTGAGDTSASTAVEDSIRGNNETEHAATLDAPQQSNGLASSSEETHTDPSSESSRRLKPHERPPTQKRDRSSQSEEPPARYKWKTTLKWTGEEHIEGETTVKPVIREKEQQELLRKVSGEKSPEAKKSAEPIGEESVTVSREDASTVSESDVQSLNDLFGANLTQDIVAMYEKIQNNPNLPSDEYGSVKSAIIERCNRGKVHQEIRRIFKSKLDSSTDGSGHITIVAMSGGSDYHARNGTDTQRKGNTRDSKVKARHERPGKPNWTELGGDYLHFSLYKENKDTMESISWLSRQMQMNIKSFQFAGTKDRRGVTVQRVSVYRVTVERIIGAGRTLRDASVGDFEYHPKPLQLGDLSGNQFVITLRDCQFPRIVSADSSNSLPQATSIVREAVDNLGQHGFINYYGLQRFGTFGISTDSIGLHMLKGDFKSAVEAILTYKPECLEPEVEGVSVASAISRDDRFRAQGIHTFQTTGSTTQALQVLPRKFGAESNIIRHLGTRGNENDYQGALMSIQRNLRLMYVHAYQSLVWNAAVSERWRVYGNRVVQGDLVLINEHNDKTEENNADTEQVDADGDLIVQPDQGDRASTAEDTFVRARALTDDEASSGKYTIFDIVLPTPGFDILYPENSVGDFYRSFMASERGGGLDPHQMRRGLKDISLSGSYRKILAQPGKELKFDVQTYPADQPDTQFVSTDMDRLRAHNHHQQRAPASNESTALDPLPLTNNADATTASKIAVILTMQLGSSTYATMALRELMKSGKGVKTWKADYAGGR